MRLLLTSLGVVTTDCDISVLTRTLGNIVDNFREEVSTIELFTVATWLLAGTARAGPGGVGMPWCSSIRLAPRRCLSRVVRRLNRTRTVAPVGVRMTFRM